MFLSPATAGFFSFSIDYPALKRRAIFAKSAARTQAQEPRLLLTAYCPLHRQLCLQSFFTSFALLSQIFLSVFSGINLHASFLIR